MKQNWYNCPIIGNFSKCERFSFELGLSSGGTSKFISSFRSYIWHGNLLFTIASYTEAVTTHKEAMLMCRCKVVALYNSQFPH